MPKNLITTSVDKASIGAELGADIIDNNGNLLMPIGSIISQESINKLMLREIESITIVEKELFSEEQIAELKKEVENSITHRFRKHSNNPLMNELKQALINYRINELEL